MTLSRRALGRSAAALFALSSLGLPRRAAAAPRFGPLVKPQDGGLLALPQGFTATVIQRAGEGMSDGYPMPAAPDGMGCFVGPGGSWALLRNHELVGQPLRRWWPEGQAPAEAFNPNVYGGVSRLLIDPTTLSLRESRMVLAGTENNCGGGASPWGWLSCEETDSPGHGWAFLCLPTDDRLLPARPQRAMGRFRREAVAWTFPEHVAVMTEDHHESALYRFVPDSPAAPFGPGKLQAMAILGKPGFDLGVGLTEGQRLLVRWVTLPDPSAETIPCREQARKLGAAIVRRGEGLAGDGAHTVVFCATSGGPLDLGQIFSLDLVRNELRLLVQSEDRARLNMPDNCVIAPWGDVLFCEDGDRDDRLMGLTPEGELYDLAHNALTGQEMAGVCFSPDGQVMFLNLQRDGVTLAVRGPFPKAR